MTHQVANRWTDTLILIIKSKMTDELGDELQQYQGIAKNKEADTCASHLIHPIP